jgi:hypothetical protein
LETRQDKNPVNINSWALGDLGLQQFSYGPRRVGSRGGAFLVLTLNSHIHFFTMDFGILRGFNAQSHLFAFDLNHSYFDMVVDRNAFAKFSGEDQHQGISFNVLVKV